MRCPTTAKNHQPRGGPRYWRGPPRVCAPVRQAAAMAARLCRHRLGQSERPQRLPTPHRSADGVMSPEDTHDGGVPVGLGEYESLTVWLRGLPLICRLAQGGGRTDRSGRDLIRHCQMLPYQAAGAWGCWRAISSRHIRLMIRLAGWRLWTRRASRRVLFSVSLRARQAAASGWLRCWVTDAM